MEEVQQLVLPTIKTYLKFLTASPHSEVDGFVKISAEEPLNLYKELCHIYNRVQGILAM
jgi:hypothetical protein